MTSISSKAALSIQNNFQYQAAYSEHDEETGYNEFALRHYDAQVGRWTGVDPYQQFASPYTGMGNNPVNGVDPDGGLSLPQIGINGSNFLIAAGNVAISSAVGYGLGYIVGGKNGSKWGAAIGFGISAGSYVPWGDVGDLFDNITWYSSMDQAALAWAKAYGEKSININEEFSSNIYEKDSGKKFTFTNPPRRQPNSENRPHSSPGPNDIAKEDKLNKKYKLKGHIHSHGGYDQETDLDFSIWKPGYNRGEYDDNLIQKNDNLSFYLFNPNGELKVSRYIKDPYTFDVSRGTVTIVRGLPYDKGAKLAKRNARYPLFKRPSKIELTEHFEY